MTRTAGVGDPLRLLVLGVVAVGCLAQLTVGLALGSTGPIARLSPPGAAPGWQSPHALLVLLAALTVVADLVAVRVRHGEQVEELTLYGAAVVLVVLLLPSGPSLVVPVAASTVCSLLRRRGVLKTMFNAGNMAAATAGLVGVLHTVSGPGGGLSGRTVVGLVLGSGVFAALNLLGLSRVLAIVAQIDPWQVVRDGARLSALEAIGTVALGGTLVTTTSASPALLPFAFAPAAALTFAYRAAAQQAQERERSVQLLALSQVLAGRRPAEEVLDAFLDLARQAFGADLALAVVDRGEVSDETPTTRVLEPGGTARAASATEQGVLAAALRGVLPAGRGLPAGWVRAVCAPLEADGSRVGVVVLATRDRHRSLGDREVAVLIPLTSALGAALRGAAHLRRLIAETAKLSAVVDHSSDGILVLDGAGHVELWSPALGALTGTTCADALARPVDDVLAAHRDGGADQPFAEGLGRLRPDAPTQTVELVLRRTDGEERVVTAAHAGVFDSAGTLQRDVVIVHDVTRERQVERLKADFIATVSHELRTPVTPIKGYADLLRRRGAQMSAAKRDECLEVIGDRADHLARLVEDLLLASRISATAGGATTQVDLAPVDLRALLERACGDFGDDGGRVQLDVPPHPVIAHGDRVRVVQVLTNLIGNALKYSAAGTPVTVRLHVQHDEAVVDVADSGRGIPTDQLERVFEKFHRVEDPLRMTTGGTGLGLYIARELAMAMGGRLGCRSTLAVGSTFTFALPVSCPGEQDGPAAEPSSVLPAPPPDAGPGPQDPEVPRPRRAPPWVTPPPPPAPADEPEPVRTLG